MLTYIETGVNFIQSYGDGPESLYDSMLSILQDSVKIFQSPEGVDLYLEFKHRLNILVWKAENTGYGFGDDVESLIAELKISMGED
ncbi:MAG: Plasmid pRiA4b ORF-3-like protein [bacterium]|nr:MAG: Plasmid pRiA4b ORF-3-like protein [bacterium]